MMPVHRDLNLGKLRLCPLGCLVDEMPFFSVRVRERYNSIIGVCACYLRSARRCISSRIYQIFDTARIIHLCKMKPRRSTKIGSVILQPFTRSLSKRGCQNRHQFPIYFRLSMAFLFKDSLHKSSIFLTLVFRLLRRRYPRGILKRRISAG